MTHYTRRCRLKELHQKNGVTVMSLMTQCNRFPGVKQKIYCKSRSGLQMFDVGSSISSMGFDIFASFARICGLSL